MASELFGFKKGAFPGAFKDKPGRFMAADKGTILLDEICNTSTAFQSDLLRVLEEGEFTPLGDIHPVKADFREVAALMDPYWEKIYLKGEQIEHDAKLPFSCSAVPDLEWRFQEREGRSMATSRI